MIDLEKSLAAKGGNGCMSMITPGQLPIVSSRYNHGQCRELCTNIHDVPLMSTWLSIGHLYMRRLCIYTGAINS